jgi:hypothetical protein
MTGMDSLLLVDDDVLSAEAMAADPDAVVPDDAIPFDAWTATSGAGRLPSWYMPAPIGPPALHGWRRFVVRMSSAMLVLSFLTITCAGLCNTYGDLHL